MTVGVPSYKGFRFLAEIISRPVTSIACRILSQGSSVRSGRSPVAGSTVNLPKLSGGVGMVGSVGSGLRGLCQTAVAVPVTFVSRLIEDDAGG